MVKVTLTGYAGRDAEKYGKITTCSINAGARINGTKDANGKYEYLGEWYNLVAFGNELKDVKKGDKLTVTAVMEYDKYTKDGEDKIIKRYLIETATKENTPT